MNQAECEKSNLSIGESSPWEVYYNGGFGHHQGPDMPGKELRIWEKFSWNGEIFEIPSVYICGKGVVLDICQRAEMNDIRAFQEKWDVVVRYHSDFCGTRTDWGEERRREAENPLRDRIRSSKAEVNGKNLKEESRYAICWNPCDPEAHKDPLIRRILSHYGLDIRYGWNIIRTAYPWPVNNLQRIRSLVLDLDHEKQRIVGPVFQVTTPIREVKVQHPFTGTVHTLRVQSCTPRMLPQLDCSVEYPMHYWELGYTLTPELPAVQVEDCGRGDQPKSSREFWTESPAAEESNRYRVRELLCPKTERGVHYVNSAPCFSSAEPVQWQVVFYEQMVQRMTRAMIEPNLLKKE